MKGHPVAEEAVATGSGAGDDRRGEGASAADAAPAGVLAGLATGTTGALFAHAATRNTMSTKRPAEGPVVPEVLSEFPYLRDFVETALFPNSNAFYVNPLIMQRGSRVGAHVDCRLIVEQDVRIIPNLVSIYYVSTADDAIGGALTLNVGTDAEVVIRPQQNDLLHFRGDVIHAVSEITSDHVRICVVCEQYNLPESLLATFPDFEIVLDEAFAPRVAAPM
jgi:hypothetical protein